jgi:sugar/nucleoside kinase (ribokinase family)
VSRDLDVVVVCEINVDIIVAGLTPPPHFGAEHTEGDVVLTAGSSGVLTATGLADLGLRTSVCGLIGDDPFGRFMLDHCDRHGIVRDGIVVDAGERTGSSVILSGRDDRAILTHPGAMARFDVAALRLDTAARARHLHLSSYFLQEALRPDVPAMLEQVYALGLTTSADTGHDPADRWEIDRLLEGLDVFLPNEVEALAITGTDTVEDALEWLASRVEVVAIKRGAWGASAARGAERVYMEGFPARVVDTTGAGDAFDAGFLDAWLGGSDLTTCVRHGNACGALAVAHIGGTGALSRARMDDLIRTAHSTG